MLAEKVASWGIPALLSHRHSCGGQRGMLFLMEKRGWCPTSFPSACSTVLSS